MEMSYIDLSHGQRILLSVALFLVLTTLFVGFILYFWVKVGRKGRLCLFVVAVGDSLMMDVNWNGGWVVLQAPTGQSREGGCTRTRSCLYP